MAETKRCIQCGAVLLFGLSHGLTLPEINDALFTAGAETLL